VEGYIYGNFDCGQKGDNWKCLGKIVGDMGGLNR
jgi:hypothetical protein